MTGESRAARIAIADEGETVLILTPIKDAVRFVNSYFSGLARLTYPAERISLRSSTRAIAAMP